MPYKRRSTYRKRRTYRKRSTNYGNIADTATRALTIATALKNLINVEKKWYDSKNSGYPTGVNISSSGAVYYLTDIAQGDTANTRDGNSIKLSSIYLTARVGLGTGATVSQNVRLMLFRDNDNQGASPTVANVLDTALISSPLNLTNPGRFSILYDKIHKVFLSSAGDTNATVMKFLKNKYHVKYGGTTSAITDARTGSIFLLAISDASANTPFLLWDCRFRFIDN